MTQERFDALIAAHERGLGIAQAAREVGLDRDVVLRWLFHGRAEPGSALADFRDATLAP